MVVREYLVENFGFDDSQLKTLGMGKQAGREPGRGLGLNPDSHLFPQEPRYQPTNFLRRAVHLSSAREPQLQVTCDGNSSTLVHDDRRILSDWNEQ